MYSRVLFFSVLCLAVSAVVCQTVRQLTEPPQPRVRISSQFRSAVYDQIAIVVIDETDDFRSGMLRRVEDEFMQAVLHKGYRLADRSNVNRVLDELEFQDSGLTDRDYAQVGQMLNVSAIMVVSINASGVRKGETLLGSVADVAGAFSDLLSDEESPENEDSSEEVYYSTPFKVL